MISFILIHKKHINGLKTIVILFIQSVVLMGNNYDYTSNIYQDYLKKHNKTISKYSLANFKPLSKLILNYNKIKENKEKYKFIMTIKNPIIKDYLELKYYQEIDSEISFQEKIRSLNKLDIFLTLPFVINELKTVNYRKYQKIIKKIYNDNKNNKMILLFYELEFMENNFDLSLIENQFLADEFHLINVIERVKKYKYKIAIKKMKKLIKFIPKSDKKKRILSGIVKWNEFFRNDQNFIDLKQIHKLSFKSPPLGGWGANTNGDKNILNQNFFNKELNTLSNKELKYENKILKKTQNISLDKDTNYIIEVKEAIRFANVNIKDLFYEITYIENEEIIKIKNAVIFKKNGDIVKVDTHDYLIPYEYDGLYSDMRILKFNLKKQLSTGDIFYIDYKVTSTNKRDYFGKKISIVEHIKPVSDIVYYEFSLKYPKNIKLNIAYNKEYLNKKIISRKEDKYEEISFIGENIQAYTYENFYQFSYKEEPYISISNFSDWKSVKKWFKDIIFDKNYKLSDKNKKFFLSLAPKSSPSNPLKGRSLKEGGGAKTPPLGGWGANKKEKIIEFFYNYILDNIHYVGIELGIHSYKPYSPDLVFENKYGDCKDRAILFHNIMKLFNIETKIVIVSSSNSDKYDFSIPSYSYFNHAIVYIPLIKKYLDLTNNKISFPYLPKSDINSKILVLNEESGIKTLNFNENELIKKEFVYKKINKATESSSTQVIKIIHKEIYHGNTGLNSLKIDFKELAKLVYERYINKYYNEIVDFKSYKVNNNLRVIPYILEFEYILSNKLNKSIISLFQQSDLFEKKFTPKNNRVNSLYFITKPNYEYSFKFIKLKKLYSFEDKVIKNTYFNASLVLVKNMVKFKFKMNVNHISAKEYGNFRNKLKKLDEILLKSYYLEFK